MQDRYAGDVGDFVKIALLRALSPGLRLGVAWYRYPDEGHNDDGRHVAYLQDPDRWRHLDAPLFDGLRAMVTKRRSVRAIQDTRLLDAVFCNEDLDLRRTPAAERSRERGKWFEKVLVALDDCDLVFADPDNGLTDDEPVRRRQYTFGKRMPLGEALALAEGRTAVVYHHNSRFRGGHDLEVDHWAELLGAGTMAVRANAYSCRTFFVVNPTATIRDRAERFCHDWRDHKVRLHR